MGNEFGTNEWQVAASGSKYTHPGDAHHIRPNYLKSFKCCKPARISKTEMNNEKDVYNCSKLYNSVYDFDRWHWHKYN